jgi:hypothetical protein
MKPRIRLVLIALALGVAAAWSQQGDRAGSDMAQGAGQFLKSLTSDQRMMANLPFEGDERYNWHYIPRERKGVPYTAMSPAQRKLADSLLATGLSSSGMRKALDIMYLDQILFEREKRDIRNPDLYFFSVFGEPSSQGAWGWRVEGHHLSLNFTLRDGRLVSSSPSFLGANPAIVKGGALDGMRVLADEELLGRELLLSFPKRERVVIQVEAPRDIVTEASRRADIGKPTGVSYGEMTGEQQRVLMDLVAFYARRMRPELADSELSRIQKAGPSGIHFAWAGGANPGDPHYYRLQGPTFLVEYDNTQNDANHIHTVWRDLQADWGDGDVLADHYATSPHHQDSRRAHRHADGTTHAHQTPSVLVELPRERR